MLSNAQAGVGFSVPRTEPGALKQPAEVTTAAMTMKRGSQSRRPSHICRNASMAPARFAAGRPKSWQLQDYQGCGIPPRRGNLDHAMAPANLRASSSAGISITSLSS